jgi:hypothetical protein
MYNIVDKNMIKMAKYKLCLMKRQMILANLLVLIAASSCNQQSRIEDDKKIKVDESKATSKSLDFENIDKSPENDEFQGNLYRNKKYHFRLEFPVNWDVNHGKAPHTVFKAQEANLGASVAINIIPWDGVEISKFTHTDVELNNTTTEIKRALESQNINPTNLVINKSFLFNFPSYTTSYNYVLRSQEYEIPYKLRQIQCLHNGGIYTVVASMPQKVWDFEMDNNINNVINSFRFEDEF